MTSMVHPTAVVEPGFELREGVKIWHFCHVRAGADIGQGVSLGQGCYVACTVRIGARCKIQNHVSLYDGVELEEDVFIGPNAVFTNVLTPRAHVSRRGAYAPTRIARGASIGANATIVCGVEVGEFALIGAGSVVTRSVPAHALMVGNPARQIGWSCECGVTLTHDVEGSHHEYRCAECARVYTLEVDRLQLLAPHGEGDDSVKP